ncbi:DUF7594 domain-containing protein [Cerasicoccus arenae]|uniref:GH16 domain-containing protein n=1 Tax=Cerasicoccus arenae TaxID=424488 RepID=A0A8J3D9P2_9BACT|nr:DNRLRE domain-containing protein [Cerasicoccus arenae]MBK1857105.1 DNRLRE domain-containing protein [Cerasicoccus arenae]GHB92395.1 hypothetical protein GCM10007047_04370 [Cerasicoccus arenae]
MKEKILPLLFSFALTSLVNAAPPPGSFTLTFEEDFSNPIIDGSKWKVGPADAFIEGSGGCNVDNFNVTGGALSIKATTDPVDYCWTTYDYSSGELTSFLRFKQKYGYFETRAKWDSVSGMWPAFWLMPERDQYGTKEWKNNIFLKFDLSSAGIGTVTDATLRLCAKNVGNTAGSDPNNLQLFRVASDSWDEGTINWNNQPVWDPLYIEQKFDYDAPAGSYVDFDVTDYVTVEVGSDGVISLALADEFRRARGQWYHSKEASNSAHWPQLIVNGVTYYPTDDATVVWGNQAEVEFGASNELSARSMYYDPTDSTGIPEPVIDGVPVDLGKGMEIDIMEAYGVLGAYQMGHATHWDGYGAGHKVSGWGPVPVMDVGEYHTYGLYWEEGLLEFYVDGVKTGSRQDARVIDVPAYILLTLQVGGSFVGNNPTPAINNQSVEFDYVRVWEGTKSGTVPLATIRNVDGTVSFGNDHAVYGGAGNSGAVVTVEDDGVGMSISKNGWIKFPLSYTVTSDTWLEFTFDSSAAGEIIGIGFEEDDTNSNDKRVFQLAGSQTWANAWQDSNDYVVESGPVTYSINVGAFYTGAMTHLVIVSDDDSNSGIYGQFRNVKITEGPAGGTPIAIGSLNNGIAADDSRSGTGYLMYSASNVISRFGAYMGNADHVIAVLYSSGQWYADKNFGQVAFTPDPADVLLATVDFTNDTVNSLEGVSGTEHGIQYGYATGDLGYIVDWWNGAANDGEFGVTGTTFTPW